MKYHLYISVFIDIYSLAARPDCAIFVKDEPAESDKLLVTVLMLCRRYKEIR